MKKTIILLVVLNIVAFFAMGNVIKAESVDNLAAASDSGEERGSDLFIRLHVRANSDSVEDQDLKLKVRNGILKYTTEKLEGITTKEDAMEAVGKNIDGITEAAQNVIYQNGYDYSVKTELKKEYFEYREYEGFFLPADVYDSLIVTIGTGNGHNWWCVIFPAVCLSGSVSESSSTEASSSKNNITSGALKKNSDKTFSVPDPYGGLKSSKIESQSIDEENSKMAINIDAVPHEYRLADKPAPKNVEYRLWIVDFFKGLFGK